MTSFANGQEHPAGPACSKEDNVEKKLFCRYDLDNLDGLAVSKRAVWYNKTMIVNNIALMVRTIKIIRDGKERVLPRFFSIRDTWIRCGMMKKAAAASEMGAGLGILMCSPNTKCVEGGWRGLWGRARWKLNKSEGGT